LSTLNLRRIVREEIVSILKEWEYNTDPPPSVKVLNKRNLGHVQAIEDDYGSNPSRYDVDNYLLKNNVTSIVASGVRRYFKFRNKR